MLSFYIFLKITGSSAACHCALRHQLATPFHLRINTLIDKYVDAKVQNKWPYLLAQYCYTSFNMMGKNFIKRAEWLTEGFYEDLSKHGVGCFSELYDGDPPHEPHGAISSAMTTAALLNINWLIEKYREE